MADRMRKIQLNNEQLQTDLNCEKSAVVKMEGHRSMLERQNKELKSKLAELETEIRSKTKSTIAALESKVIMKITSLNVPIKWLFYTVWMCEVYTSWCLIVLPQLNNMEEQLEVEARDRLAQARANRRLEKKLKEIVMQVEDERRHADQYKEQLDKVPHPTSVTTITN